MQAGNCADIQQCWKLEKTEGIVSFQTQAETGQQAACKNSTDQVPFWRQKYVRSRIYQDQGQF